MDREIGSTFYHNGTKLKVVESDSCKGCFLYERDYFDFPICEYAEVKHNIGNCAPTDRADKKEVMFIKVEKQGNIKVMTDISGTPLNVGDKVSIRHDQLTRIGLVLGFTKTKVIVGLDYTANGFESLSDLVKVKAAPYNLTKVINQDVGLLDYYKLRD